VQLQGKLPLQNSPAMDIFKQLVTSFDSEGRYHLFNAMANQLRYPNRYIPMPTRLPYSCYFLTCYAMLCYAVVCYDVLCPVHFTVFASNYRYCCVCREKLHCHLRFSLHSFVYSYFSAPYTVIHTTSRVLYWLCSEKQTPRLSKNRSQESCWRGSSYTDRTL
jgi:hypothetical protein